MLDPPELLREVLGLQQTTAALPDEMQLAALLDELGYRLRVERRSGGTVLHLAPYPVVRRIYVKGNNWPLMPLFEEDILRRFRFRPGQRLPEASEIPAVFAREKERMQRFLAHEGYFEGSLTIRCRGKTSSWGPCQPIPADEQGRVDLQVLLYKGRSYKLGDVRVSYARYSGERRPGALPDVSVATPILEDEEIARFFRHRVLLYRRSFNTDRFKKDTEELQKRFFELGYPGVRINESFIVDPCRPSDRAVRIKLRIDPRRKIDIEYRGNENIGKRELGKALTIYESGTYDDYELNESAEQIRKVYQSKGYLQARVRFTRKRAGPNTDRVTFIIEEGTRFRVKRVTFVGNEHIAAKELSKQIRTRRFPWLGYIGLGEGGYVTDTQLQQDAARLTSYYRSQGFSQVRVFGELAPHPALLGRPGALAAAVTARQTSGSGEAFVRFTVNEGPQTRVERIRIHATTALPVANVADPGQSTNPPAPEAADVAERASSTARGSVIALRPAKLSFPQARLRERLAGAGLAPGEPFTAARLKRAKEALLAFFAERGHPYAEVGSLESVTPDRRSVDVDLTVHEDKPVRIGAIFIRGNFKTRKSTIRDALGFRAGDVFDIRKKTTAEARLRRLRIFNSVRIRFIGLRQKPSRVPVVVIVEERYDDHGAIEFAVGGSSDNLFFGAVSYTNNNLFGFGTGLELRGELGLEIRSVNARYTDVQLFGTSFSFDTSGFWRQEITERLGDITTFGGTATVSRELLRRLNAYMRYEIRRIKRREDLHRPATSTDEQSRVDVFTTTAGIGPALVYDLRDNPVSPTRGLRLAASVLWASEYLGSTDNFLKFNVSGQLYVPLPLDITLALGVRYDHGVPLGGAILLPKVERMFAGGDTTIRGFEEDRAFAERIVVPTMPYGGATILRVIPRGGNIRLLSNFEIQFPIWKESPLLGRDLMAALFIDNGVVLNSFDQFEWNEFRHGAGFALRIVLPVGFASFEFGFPLDPMLGDPPDGWRFHFNFGFIL